MIIELILMLRIDWIFQAQITVTEIYKLKDINPGDILKNSVLKKIIGEFTNQGKKLKSPQNSTHPY
jgi:hypothetical protein